MIYKGAVEFNFNTTGHRLKNNNNQKTPQQPRYVRVKIQVHSVQRNNVVSMLKSRREKHRVFLEIQVHSGQGKNVVHV